MNEWIKQLFSLTISGALLLFVLLLLKKLYKNRFSKCWQYYIWLAVTLRFLIPFAPDIRIARTLLQTVGQPEQSVMTDIFSTGFKSAAQDTYISGTQPDAFELLADKDLPDNAAQAYKTDAADELVSVDFEKASVPLFFIWLIPALVILLRKVLAYRKFMRYIRTKGAEVSDLKILNILAACEEKCGIRTPVELYYRPLFPTAVGAERPLKNGQTASLDFRAQIRLLHADIKVSEYEAAYRGLADAAMEFLTSKTDAELSDTSVEATKRITKEALMAMQKYAKRICKKGNINLTVNWCSYFPEGDILDIPNKVTPGGTTKREQLPEKIKKILTIKVKDYKNDTLSDFLDYTAQRYEADNSLWKASQGYWTLLDEKTIRNLSREDYEFLTVTLPCTASESTYPGDRASRFPAGFGSSFDLAYPKRGTKIHFEWYVNYEIKNPELTVGQRDQLILNVTYGMDDFLQNTPKTADIGSEEYLKEMSSCLKRLAKENSKAGLEMTVFQCQGG